MSAATPLPAERLVLRELEEADWAAVHAYASKPEVVRFMNWGPNSEEETKAFVESVIASRSEEPRRRFEFAVTLRADGRLIGACGLTVSDPETRQAWVGYCYHPRFWRQGYATEAARSLVAFGFEHLGLHRIFATCDVENVASARVLEKVGMRREGHLREHAWVRGRWRDSFLYAVLAHEWPT